MDVTQARSRLRELERERARGLRTMNELDTRRHELRETLLRIQGAIQVLEELIESDASACAPTP